MKDYKRLTVKSVGCFKYCLKNHKSKNGEFKDYDTFFDYSMAVKRLGELEDKIERGEIDYVADKDKEIARLTAENAELKARLEMAVKLPFSHLETLKLLTCASMCYAKIRELITERMASSNDIKDLFMHIPLIQGTTLNFALNCLDKSNLNCNKIKGFEEVLNAMGDFKNYLAKAEARLAELGGH